MTDTLARQQQREDTAADWTSVDPVLRAGEFGWESDTEKLKIGDGATPWSALPYWYGTASDILAIVASTIAATAISSATAVTPDSAASSVYRYAITGSGSITGMTLTGGTTRPSLVLMVKRSASQTVVWDSTIDFAHGFVPVIPATGWLTLALFYDDSTGRWVERYRSPDAAVPATTSYAGVVPLGSDADAVAGTSTSVAVVPHALAAALAAYIVAGNPVLDGAVDALLASGTSLTGVDLAARLAVKINLPAGGSGGNALIKDPVTGAVVWGASPGALTLLSDGTLETTVNPPTGTAKIILPAGGFMNGIQGPDPSAWPVQAGAPLRLIGDVYGLYTSPDQASNWVGGDDGLTDVKHKKGVSSWLSKTAANTAYRFTSNYNGSNAGAVLSALWKQVYDPTTRRDTSHLLFDSVGGNPDAAITAAQPNLYRAQGDGAGHPRQTGKMGFADPLVDGRGYLCHGDGVVQYTESGGVTLKAFNGATVKDTCYALIMDPTKVPTSGVDAYVAIASGTDVGVWRINNIQLPGKVGDVGGPTATQLTGGAAPFQPLGIAAVSISGTTHLIVTDAGLSGNPGGIRHWNGSTWSDVTPTGAPAPSSGVPGATGGLAGGLANGGTGNTGVIVYKAVDAVYLSGPGTVRCVVGHDGPDQSGTSKMMWTDDVLTATGWHFHVDGDNLANFPLKGSAQQLWLGNAPNGAPYTYFMMTKTQGGWDCSDIWIDRGDPTKCYASGRSGLWYFTIGGGTVAAQPASDGLGAAINLAAAAHPTNPAIVAAGDSDWCGLHWLDINGQPRMLEHTSGSPALPNNVDGREIRFDPLGGLALGQAQRSTFNGGDIWFTADSTIYGNWYSLMHGNNVIGAYTDFGVRGFSVYKHTDGELVFLAYIGPQIAVSPGIAGDPTHAGIWKLKGLWNASTQRIEHSGSASTWTRVSSIFSTFTNQFQVIRGDHGRTVTDAGRVYSYDPLTSGAVRSLDNGDTWASFFPRTFRAIYRYSGGVKCDKLVPNRVWVTIPGFGGSPGEVWRIDNAHDGTLSSAGATLSGTITATKVNTGATGANLDCPGQLVVKNDGTVVVHQGVQGPGASHHAGLWQSRDAGVSWVDLGDATLRGGSQFVYGMALTADEQTIILANDGNGVLRFPLAPPSTTVDLYSKPQVDAIRASLQTEIDAANAAIAALGVTPDIFLTVGTTFVVTSQPTLQDVTDGGAPGVGTVRTATLPVGTYEVYGYLSFDSSATDATHAKAKVGLAQGTATFTGEMSFRGTSSSNGAASASINTGATTVPGSQSMGAAGVGVAVTAAPIGVITVTVAGTVKLQWAQNATEATNTSLHGSTFLGFKKIA